MTDFENALITRDGLSPGDAIQARKQTSRHILNMIGDGSNYEDIEEYLMCEWGLEMDYITDLVDFGGVKA